MTSERDLFLKPPSCDHLVQVSLDPNRPRYSYFTEEDCPYCNSTLRNIVTSNFLASEEDEDTSSVQQMQ
jgi:hypothetical protein